MRATQAGTQEGLDINKSDKEKLKEKSEKFEKLLEVKKIFVCRERYASEEECRRRVPDYMGIRCDLCRRGGAI